VLGLPDPNPSDHPSMTVLAAVCAGLALILGLWRRPPTLVLHGVCPVGTLAVGAGIALADPIGLTPAFTLWPLTVAAYFFARREVLANGAFAALVTGTSLALWAEPGLRAATFVASVGIAGAGASIVLAMREEIRALVRRLQILASCDPLTGALSRIAFDERVTAELERAARSGAPYAMAAIDIDHFKDLNDRFGHAAGDEGLRSLARVIDDERRVSDVFGRIGGDEFAILVLDTDLDGAERLAERVRERMALLGELRGWPTTLSIGLADGETLTDDLLRRADQALYTAKREGRNRVVRSDALERATSLAAA
jgi:diguanylate cyclase (GGDEF)-like protein